MIFKHKLQFTSYNSDLFHILFSDKFPDLLNLVNNTYSLKSY